MPHCSPSRGLRAGAAGGRTGRLQSNAELAHKLEELEKKYDGQFRVVFDAIRELMAPRDASSRRIGFDPEPDE